ncbi:trifunctional histidinol dehydrogenase [Entophlyctis luteolus]|nr:trifunctional histidinol dehydrogenase [Entophlyctis luteolus]
MFVVGCDSPPSAESPLPAVARVLLRTPLSVASVVSSFIALHPRAHDLWVSAASNAGESDVIALLDAGAARVVLDASSELFPSLPYDRIVARFSTADDLAVDAFKPAVNAIIVPADLSSADFLSSIAAIKEICKRKNMGLIVEDVSNGILSSDVVASLDKMGLDIILQERKTNLSTLSEYLFVCLVSDRADGLVATAIVDEQRVCLGVAYSSAMSLAHAIENKVGAYYSRSRNGLWIKGLTSGAVQALERIDRDCDSDCLQFTVRQAAPGFCHLNTRTCFGPDSGLTALQSTLQLRKENAPKGSYTAKLFDDSKLLHAKIREEADELCAATTRDDIAWETADLFYFSLAKCVANGVGLNEIEAHLEKRAKKVTRRPGNAKPGYIEKDSSSQAAAAASVPPVQGSPVLDIKMKVYDSTALSSSERSSLLLRPILNLSEISARVAPIIESVRTTGDAALIALTSKFDGVQLSSTVVRAPFSSESMRLDPRVKAAIDSAFENIKMFHAAQVNAGTLTVETMPGVVCSRFSRPIERVGLYVPGGTAILPSTTLMLGVPAMVAGCKEIVIASPPRRDGTPVPEVVYVASKIGASAIVLAGGAQAIAAMAFGTESVPKVDKIVGPGNQYVTAAKMQLQNDTKAMISIDMPAGPSELLVGVIADNDANPAYVVSDLLSQAEHGTDSQVILVAIAPTPTFVAAIQRELQAQGEALPRRDIVRVSISKSYIITVPDISSALEFSNLYAPEHLILHIEEPATVLPRIQNAGSVFVGPWSPESCGDYASGTNHTLPTYGYARMYSGVNTDTFVKWITSQEVSRDGLDAGGLGDVVLTLAEVEGLEAHRNALVCGLNEINFPFKMVYTIVVHLYAKDDPECIAKLHNKLVEASAVYSKDKETISWFVMQDHIDKRAFTIVERYEQESSQQYHLGNPYWQTFDPYVIPLLDRPMDLRRFNELEGEVPV